MYGCESWTIKKTEGQRTDALNCGVGEDFWESLGQQADQTVAGQSQRKSTLNIGAEAPVLWPPDGKSQLIGKLTEDEMVGWHHWLNRLEFEEAPGDGEGQGSLVCCSPWGHKESHTTERLNNNNNLWNVQYIHRQQKPHWSQFPGMSAGTEHFCRVEQRCYQPLPFSHLSSQVTPTAFPSGH